jgi:hypothetical protein
MTQRNSVNWESDESMAAIRAGQGLLVGLLRCGHCGRKLHVRYWGGRGTHARYLCKGDYDDGGQYCLGFGGTSVDRRLGQELLRVISPFGVEASLRAMYHHLPRSGLVHSTVFRLSDYPGWIEFRPPLHMTWQIDPA